VLATQCLLAKKSKSMLVRVDGRLAPGDREGSRAGGDRPHRHRGGTGHAIEFAAARARAVVEGRMTMCNMAIEAGARAGMVACDGTTIDYLRGRPFAPVGAAWDRATRTAHARLRRRRALRCDARPRWRVDRAAVTWGTSPEMVVRWTAVPDPDASATRPAATAWRRHCRTWGSRRTRDDRHSRRQGVHRLVHELAHRGPAAGRRGRPRPSRRAEREARDGGARLRAREGAGRGRGLDRVFRDAGFEWREPGCSMCLAMNDDRLEPGERCASTSNRNSRAAGAGGRTHLVSRRCRRSRRRGHFVDVRRLS